MTSMDYDFIPYLATMPLVYILCYMTNLSFVKFVTLHYHINELFE